MRCRLAHGKAEIRLLPEPGQGAANVAGEAPPGDGLHKQPEQAQRRRTEVDGSRAAASTSRRVGSTSQQASANAPTPLQSLPSLQEARQLLGLKHLEFRDVLEAFTAAADGGGSLGWGPFHRVARALWGRGAAAAAAAAQGHAFRSTTRGQVEQPLSTNYRRAKLLWDRIFSLFDKRRGVVDVLELTSGLSVLCRGGHQEKARAAFLTYDTDAEGLLSFGEMATFMRGIFRIVCEFRQGTAERCGLTPEELAIMTTERAFRDAELGRRERIGLEDFSRWFSTALGRVTAVVASSTSGASVAVSGASSASTSAAFGGASADSDASDASRASGAAAAAAKSELRA